MKKASNRMKHKKGFSLAECIVALLLFSVVTVSVLSVFTASRNQIKKQNDQYKIEMMASNLLAAYEGSNTSGSFKNRLNGLGLELSSSDAFNTTIGTEGTGQYSFDTQNVPIAVPFSKIVVKDGSATFRNENDSGDMVSFVGTYPDNKLPNGDGWAYSTYFNEAKKRQPTEMILTGKAYPAVALTSYDFTLTVNESTVSMVLGSMADPISKPACDFDQYLLANGYYLKADYKIETSGTLGSTYNYRFQLYNAADNTPAKVGGKNLYYCISISAISALATNNADMQKVVAGTNNGEGFYFNLSNCTIKYYTGDSCPSYSSFKTELKNGDKKFSGNWYFLPWFVYKNDGNIVPTCDKFTPGLDYYEYTAKSGVASNLYYALNTAKNTEMLLFNSDGSLIFPYKADSADPLRNLVSNCGFGIDGKRNTLAIYEGTTYDKWFKRGAVPLWNVTKARFTDGGGSAVSKIVFYGVPEGSSTESEYITFLYSPDKYSDFVNDRNSILDFGSVDSKWYNYEKNFTAKSLKNISDDSGLAPYKEMDAIKAKNLGATSTEKTLLYYAISRKDLGSVIKHNYQHTYTYYSYKITSSKSIQLTNYKEDAHTLKIVKSGDAVTCTETISDSATVKTVYTYTVTPIAQGKTVSVQTGKDKEPPSTPPVEVQGGTQVDELRKTHIENTGFMKWEEILDWDYTDVDWVKTDQTNSAPAGSEEVLHGLVSGSTYSVVPEDLATSWNLTAEPAEAALHTVAEFTALGKHTDMYEVQVGGNTVFTAHTDDFNITAGGVSASNTDCAYDVVGGEAADIKAETYYITWTSGDVTLISLVTYSNFTKEFEVDGVKVKKEPKIMIWSIPKSEVPADVKNVTDSSYDKYLYRVYRKG